VPGYSEVAARALRNSPRLRQEYTGRLPCTITKFATTALRKCSRATSSGTAACKSVALLLEKSVVYHPGRTGGHWVKAVLRRAGLVRWESARLHDSPEDLRHWPEGASRPWSIAFVRHPLSWVRSLWLHETHLGWTNDLLRPDDEFATFPEYLDYLIEAFPGGAVKRYFAFYRQRQPDRQVRGTASRIVTGIARGWRERARTA
jgi:hypothetical protein